MESHDLRIFDTEGNIIFRYKPEYVISGGDIGNLVVPGGIRDSIYEGT